LRPGCGNCVLDVEIGLGPLVARFQQLQIEVDDPGVLLPEDEADLLTGHIQVEAVDAAEEAEDEHVLAPGWVGNVLHALPLHRDLVQPEALRLELVIDVCVGNGDLGVGVRAPLVLQQNDAARFELLGAIPPEQDLLVEGDHQVGFVTAIGDLLGGHADAVSARPGDAARRRLYLGGDDLDGPNAVAHARRDRSEGLAAALRALARVADDLDDMLLERYRFLGCRRPATALLGLASRPRLRLPGRGGPGPLLTGFLKGLFVHCEACPD
jgi:hypothetical protein